MCIAVVSLINPAENIFIENTDGCHICLAFCRLLGCHRRSSYLNLLSLMVIMETLVFVLQYMGSSWFVCAILFKKKTNHVLPSAVDCKTSVTFAGLQLLQEVQELHSAILECTPLLAICRVWEVPRASCSRHSWWTTLHSRASGVGYNL